MTSCLVLGAKGFLGSNFVKYLNAAGFEVHEGLRGTSRAELVDTTYDVVFNCAGNSKTWLSDKAPLTCLQENVVDLVNDIQALQFGVWVQISSSTVYGSDMAFADSSFQEDCPIRSDQLGTYAFHKLLAEHYIQRLTKSWLILRPTGFFGPGLKKNLLFDLRYKKSDIFYTLESFIDYMPVEFFCELAVVLASKAVGEIVNVGSGAALSVEEIVKPFDGIKVDENARYVDNREFSLKKLKQYYPAMPNEDDIKNQVLAFVKGGAV